MSKRVFSFVLCLVLLSALFAVPASAVQPAAVQTGDFLYLGEYNGAPVKWRILNAAATNTGEKGMFLISEYVLDTVMYSDHTKFWVDSDARVWCTDFAAAAFTPRELALIPSVSKTEEPFQLYDLSWDEGILEEEQAFFLSVREVADYFDAESADSGMDGHSLDGGSIYWWLRTPHAYHLDYAGYVLDGNWVHDFMIYGAWGARPAINLLTDNVLSFLPAGEAGELGTVSPLSANEQREWKLLLQDDSRGLTVDETALNGSVLTVSYSGAATGADEYISLLVCDSQGSATAYGKLLQPAAASGTLDIDMSGFTMPQGGNLYLFSEQDNGPQSASVAGALTAVGVAVRFDAGKGSGAMEPIYAAPGQTVTLPETCGFTPPEHAAFDHWELEGVPVEQVPVNSELVLTAVYTPIPVTGMSFTRSSYELLPSDQVEIIATFEPAGAIDMELEWSCSNDQVVSVLNNRDGSSTITARRGGVAVVTATSPSSGLSASVTVNVVQTDASHALPLMIGLGALALLLVAGVILLLVRRRR